MSAIEAIDNSPLFKLLTKAVMEGPDALVRGLGHVLANSGVGDGSGSVSPLRSDSDGIMASIGNFLGGKEGHAIEVASPQPERVIEQFVAKSTFDANPADLGNLSAPAFGGGGMTRSTGMSV